jgi:DNA invertase Pin-like site-specific DNA recombinase
MKRPACYCRVSSKEQVEGYSLDAQVRAIEAHCAAHGWPSPAIYADEGRSAYTDVTEKRPQFAAMLDAAEAGQHDVVIVHKLDRFARSLMVTLRELKRLEEHRVGFVSLSESMDFTTPIGRVILATLAAFAEYYSRNLSTEVRKGIMEKREQGEHVGGIPWGALRREGKLAIDPAHAETLALLLELARDRSPQAVATELNRRAIPPPRTAAWWPETVRGIVRHGAWLAEQPEPWPARWREAAKRPPLPRFADPSRKARELSGLLRCACGGSMQYSRTWTRPDGSTGYSVRCRRRAHQGGFAYCPGGRHTNADEYTRQVESAFFALPNMADFRRLPGGEGAAERAQIGQRRQSLVLALAEGLPSEEYYRRKADLDREEALLPPTGGQLVGLLQEIQIAQDGWGALGPAQKNAIWRLLFEKVVARGATAEVVPSKALAALLAALG